MNKFFNVFLVALVISLFPYGVLGASKDIMPQKDMDVAWPEVTNADTLGFKVAMVCPLKSGPP